MKNKVYSVYLKFAEINIALDFLPTEEGEYFEKPFLNQVKNIFGGYFLEAISKIDHRIILKKVDHFEFFCRAKEKKNYLLITEKKSLKSTVTYYYVSMSQLQIILRDICQEFLSKRSGMILHGSAAEKNGGYIFFGNSGAGKSTIVKRLSPFLDPLADDSIIIKKTESKWLLYQTPINQKNSLIKKTSEGVKIKKIFFIKKSQQNRVVKIDKKAALIKLIKQLYTDQKNSKKQMAYLMDFVEKNDFFYDLYFNLDNFPVLFNKIYE